jgi:hypothetical protein
VTGAIAALLSGCGGSGNAALPGPTPEQLVSRFHARTGATLTLVDRHDPQWAVLVAPASFEQYGQFSIYVVKTATARRRLLTDSLGKPWPHDGAVLWKHEQNGPYTALRQYGAKVIVAWEAGDARRVDARFQALSRAMTAALSAKASRLPEADRPCRAVGIDRSKGTREGSCRLGRAKLTVVNASDVLRTPVMTARLTGVTTTPAIGGPHYYDRPALARGAFIVVGFRVDNTGGQPIDFLNEKLIVDGHTYTANPRVAFSLSPGGFPLPIQPGEHATVRSAFDVPAALVHRALTAGALSLPAARLHNTGIIDDITAQGVIRLAGAPGGGLPHAAESAHGTSPAQRRQASSARRAVREFFAAIRRRDIHGVCSLQTDAVLGIYGGLAACSRSAVTTSVMAKIPPASATVALSTVLSHRLATVVVRGAGYTSVVTLISQHHYWRVAAFTRLR